MIYGNPLDRLEWSEYLSIVGEVSDHRVYSSSTKQPTDWHGTDNSGRPVSFDSAVDMATSEGYVAAAMQAEAIAGQVREFVQEYVTRLVPKPERAVVGKRLNMSAYLAGDPRMMIRKRHTPVPQHGKAVRIAVPITTSCSTPADVIMRRGAAVLALIGILRQLGNPLDLWAIDARHGGRTRWVDAVHVLRADEVQHEERVMFALAHPAMLRRLAFSAMEHAPERVQRALGGGYGSPPYDARPEDMPDDHGGTSIILPDIGGHRGNKWTVPECVDWIRAQLDLIYGR